MLRISLFYQGYPGSASGSVGALREIFPKDSQEYFVRHFLSISDVMFIPLEFLIYQAIHLPIRHFS